MPDRAWSLVYDDFDIATEGQREALCTLCNGYFSTRGAAVESRADDTHYPGVYLAGGYNRTVTSISGRSVENEDLVNLPNWLSLRFRIDDGDWFNLMAVEILAYGQELDLKQGVLHRAIRFRDKTDKVTRVRERRLVHMGLKNIAALELTIEPENWAGQVEVCSALDGEVVNAGVKRYLQLNNQHLEPVAAECNSDGLLLLKVRTTQSDIRITQAVRTRVSLDGLPVEPNVESFERPLYLAQHLATEVPCGGQLTVEKVVALATSRDRGISECGLEAEKLIHRQPEFKELLRTHTRAWRHIWSRVDIAAGAQSDAESIPISAALRLHLFHLLQTTSEHSIGLDVGVPARGWHGEAYRGHIFWDELFILPMLNFIAPEVSRALLRYRFRRLNQARENALAAGYRGAMFPWQSASDGREETQQVHMNPRSGSWTPDRSRLQRHVNAAIAFNIWSYFQSTLDHQFMSYAGAEMIFEIARFWASAAHYIEPNDRYEIHGVMGPDEYHDGYPGADEGGLRNNSYTNFMAVWVLVKALELTEQLPSERCEELFDSLEITPDELESWQRISRRMKIVFHDDGIISQFEGYEELEEFDWEGYESKYENIQRLDRILEAEGTSPNRYKASKQADVLMLFYLFSSEELGEIFERLGYDFDPSTIPANIEYYLQRTSNGSTLSNVVHSWVLARSDRKRSLELLCQALQSDVADIQGGTTAEGIHLGAMAGVVNVMQRVTTGIELRGDRLQFNPELPTGISRLRMRVSYRQHFMELTVTESEFSIQSLSVDGREIQISVGSESAVLTPGAELAFPVNSSGVGRAKVPCLAPTKPSLQPQ